MPRGGLYKSDVKKARDALVAQGKHPSLDAVRIELGNTGSKTTIHKYLKELEEEDGGATAKKASVSETLQDLVERLAAQLQGEANAKIDEAQGRAAEAERQHADKLETANQQIASLKRQLEHAETQFQNENAAHGDARDQLQKESIARHTAEQQVADLKERLLENENHRRSLEEKHQHAREALDHYRTSVKEQREQDARRHEQQVQQFQAEIRTLQQSLVVKQEDVTRLNQEGARLVTELSHVKQALYERDAQLRQFQQKLETAQAFEERCRLLENQLAEKDAQANDLKGRLADAAEQVSSLHQQNHQLQIHVATAHAKLEAQQTLVADLRTHLEQIRHGQSTAPASVNTA